MGIRLISVFKDSQHSPNNADDQCYRLKQRLVLNKKIIDRFKDAPKPRPAIPVFKFHEIAEFIALHNSVKRVFQKFAFPPIFDSLEHNLIISSKRGLG